MKTMRWWPVALVMACGQFSESGPARFDAAPDAVDGERPSAAPEPEESRAAPARRRGGEGKKAGRMRDGLEAREALRSLGYLGGDVAEGEPFDDADRGRAGLVDAPNRQLAALRAGATDDNADYPAFLSFLGTWTDRPGMSEHYQRLDLRDRGYVNVTDAAGRPLPGARVVLRSGGERIQEARTYGDGSAPLYPWVSGALPHDLEVEVRFGDAVRRAAWAPGAELDLSVDVEVPLTPSVPVDVAFVLDTTGSMSDEIDRIKQTLLTTVERLEGLDRDVSLRLGGVLYRDRGDAYVTREIGFTGDAVRFDQAMRRVRAGGGGDGPESLNEGLSKALSTLRWRDGAAKVAFLIADARPHMDYDGDTPYGTTALEAVGDAVRVHTVAASGLDDVGSLVFRQVAAVTQGQFVFIEYGGDVAGSARDHGVAHAEQLASNNLDQILFDRVRAEVDGWRR